MASPAPRRCCPDTSGAPPARRWSRNRTRPPASAVGRCCRVTGEKVARRVRVRWCRSWGWAPPARNRRHRPNAPGSGSEPCRGALRRDKAIPHRARGRRAIAPRFVVAASPGCGGTNPLARPPRRVSWPPHGLPDAPDPPLASAPPSVSGPGLPGRVREGPAGLTRQAPARRSPANWPPRPGSPGVSPGGPLPPWRQSTPPRSPARACGHGVAGRKRRARHESRRPPLEGMPTCPPAIEAGS